MPPKISSGCKVIDKLLLGGFEPDVITTFYGPASSGKSNIALIASLSIAAQAKKAIFIDTEGGFSLDRIQQLAPKGYEALLKNILLLKPTSFEEQKKYLSQLSQIVSTHKVGIILVDSIAMLYRLQKGSEEEIRVTNRELAQQLSSLSEIARKKNIPVVVTNQVYADFGKKEGPENFHMVGGDLLKYWSKCIVKLELVESIRKASIFKHRSLPEGRAVYFKIKENGLEEVPEPKKRFSLF